MSLVFMCLSVEVCVSHVCFRFFLSRGAFERRSTTTKCHHYAFKTSFLSHNLRRLKNEGLDDPFIAPHPRRLMAATAFYVAQQVTAEEFPGKCYYFSY